MVGPEQDVAQESEGGDRPWERPGGVRRDCAPHRGNVLRLLGVVGLVLGFLSPVLVVPGVVGVPLSVAVLVLSNQDLGRMRQGLLDPAGRAETERAGSLALAGLFLSAVGLLACGPPLLWLVMECLGAAC